MKKTVLLLLCAALFLSIGCHGRKGTYDIDGIVRIGFSDIDPVCDQEELALHGVELLKALEAEDEALLCLMVDSSMSISKEELGDFDHLLVVNPAYLDRFANGASFRPCRPKEVTEEMQTFLRDHFQLWCKDADAASQVQIGTCEGKPLLALPFAVGMGSSAIEAKRPLVLLVKTPSAVLKWRSFLGGAVSSSNVVFTDRAHLEELLHDSPLLPYIRAIEPFSLDAVRSDSSGGK